MTTAEHLSAAYFDGMTPVDEVAAAELPRVATPPTPQPPIERAGAGVLAADGHAIRCHIPMGELRRLQTSPP